MSVFRPRLAMSAVFVTALTVTATAGCASASKQGPSANPTLSSSARPSATSAAGRAPQAGDLLVSNGTATVTFNGTKVSFPTTVTDAAWSPDRSRIAFIDGDGNLDSSHPDGTGRLVLARPASGATFSDPAWGGDQIFYTRTTAAGSSNVKAVYANGWVSPYDAESTGDDSAIGGEDSPTTDNSAASVSTAHLANGLSREAALQHKGSNGPEVWIVDQYQRGSTSVKLAQGTQPAVSPDGTRVAYVGTDGQIRLVPSTVAVGQAPKSTVISTGLAAPTHLAWAPDGASIAFSTASGIESIPSNGTATKPGVARQLSTSAGVAGYAGGAQDLAERLSSTDPIAGAIAVTQTRYQTTKTYQVSQNSAFAYGVALANPADPVAAELGAGYQPILYTGANLLDPRTKAELLRIFGAPNTADDQIPTVTIVGDTSMVSTAVENAVKALGYKTARVSGADRYALNAAAVKAYGQPSGYQRVVLVSGDDPAVLAAAALTGDAVLLTRGSTLPSYVSTFLSGLGSGTTIYAVGASAQAALGSWSKSGVKVVPLSGADAAQTSVLLAKDVLGSPAGVILVDPAKAADGDVAVTAAQQYGYAVLLVDPAKGVEPATRAFLDDSSAGLGTTLAIGPSGTLSDALVQQAMGAAGDAEGITLGVTYSGS